VINADSTAFEITGSRNGVTFTDEGATLSRTDYLFDTYHLMTVQEGGTITQYVNGTVAFTVASGGGIHGPIGSFNLGSFSSGGSRALNGYLDGWRIWNRALSATQVSDLYDAESAVKDDFGIIGMPPFLWTKDGDDGIDAVAGAVSAADKDNYVVIGGVSGDVPAEVEWRIDLATSGTPKVVWLGRTATGRTFSPYMTTWLEYQGTGDTGNSSDDAYEQDATGATGSDTHDFDATLNEKYVTRGRFQVLGRFRTIGQSYSVQPYFQLGASSRVLGDAVTAGTTSAMVLRDFGDMWIDWPQSGKTPTLKAGLLATETAATAGTVQCDFVQLMPTPNCRVECESGTSGTIAIASGDTLVVAGQEAWMEDASDSDSQLYRFRHQGDEVTVKPGAYNYVYFLLGEEGQTYTVTRTATVQAKVTPRYLLPGGVVS